jgi:hypothetical protein
MLSTTRRLQQAATQQQQQQQQQLVQPRQTRRRQCWHARRLATSAQSLGFVCVASALQQRAVTRCVLCICVFWSSCLPVCTHVYA